MSNPEQTRDILLIEDNVADVRLTQEVLKGSKVKTRLSHVPDGVEAMAFLKREGKYVNMPRPHLMLLDLNLPRKDGREVLAEVKSDHDLMRIPIVVLTISKAEEDIVRCYNLHANCYIAKPIDLNQFTHVVRFIEDFWLTMAELPDEVRLTTELWRHSGGK